MGKGKNRYKRHATNHLVTKKETDPEYIDLLTEDRPIAGQNYCCVSIVCPEDILANKNVYFFSQFIKSWELIKSLEKFTQFLNFMSYKHNIPIAEITTDFEEFVKEESSKLKTYSSLYDDYKTFMDKKGEELQDKFNVDNQFQTNVRGIKLRGNFSTLEETNLRAKMLRETEPYITTFVGHVGKWMPLDIDAYKAGNVEHLNEDLNQLMHEKAKNEVKAKQEFDTRVNEAKRLAIEENLKKAQQTGASMTQTIDENNNLVSIKKEQMATVDEIREALFEGEDILCKK